MPRRFWLPSTGGTDSITPSGVPAGWNVRASAAGSYNHLIHPHAATSPSLLGGPTIPAAGQYGRSFTYISAGLPAQTLIGTVKLGMYTRNIGNQDKLAFRVLLLNPDYSFKALVTPMVDGVAMGNWPGNNQTISSAVTAVEVAAGDHLAVEIGTKAVANNSFGQHLFGSPTDFPNDSDSGGNRGFVEFSQDVLDPPTPPNPPATLEQVGATLTSVEVAWTPPSTGPVPTSYDLRVDGGAPSNVGLTTTQEFTGLETGDELLVEVRSVKADTGLRSAWRSTTAQTLTGVVTVDGTPLRVKHPDGQWHAVELV